ncbi:hypothetical protein Tco_1397751 [Tanacetum coccineum]
MDLDDYQQLLSLLIVIDSHLDITFDHRPGSAGNTSITPDSVHAGGRVHSDWWLGFAVGYQLLLMKLEVCLVRHLQAEASPKIGD